MTRTINRQQFGLHYGDRVLSDADYADDLALGSDSPSKLTEALQILADEALKIGLSINWQKTKVMYVEPRNSPRPPPVLMIGDKPAEIVEEFTYLGSILSNDGSILKDLMHQIAKASAVVGRLSALWRKLSISHRFKMCIYNASVGSVLLCRAETWPATQSVVSTMNIAQTRQCNMFISFSRKNKNNSRKHRNIWTVLIVAYSLLICNGAKFPSSFCISYAFFLNFTQEVNSL